VGVVLLNGHNLLPLRNVFLHENYFDLTNFITINPATLQLDETTTKNPARATASNYNQNINAVFSRYR